LRALLGLREDRVEVLVELTFTSRVLIGCWMLGCVGGCVEQLDSTLVSILDDGGGGDDPLFIA